MDDALPQNQQPGDATPAPFALAMARRYGIVALRVGLPLVVVFLVWDELSSIDVHGVRALLTSLPPAEIALALLAAAATVAVAGLYDVLAFPDTADLKRVKRWGFGTVVACWTNFLAVGPFGGPAVRFYVYRRAGLETGDIGARLGHLYAGMISGFLGWTIAALVPFGDSAASLVGRTTLAFVAAPLCSIVILQARRRLPFGGDNLAPGNSIPLALLGAADWGMVTLVFVLVAHVSGISLPAATTLRTMVIGHAAGFASMVPGGIGTADVTWIKLFTAENVDASRAAATVVLFRFVLYVVPWFAALIALYLYSARRWEAAVTWQRRAVAAAVVMNSAFLLAASALPATRVWLSSFGRWLPLEVVEVSHAFSVLGAITMLFLARGIYRGYRAAFLIVAALLAGSMLSHVLRGSAPETSIVSAILLLMLLAAHQAFDRRGRVPIRGEYFLAVAVGSLTFFVLMGLLGSGGVPYVNSLWTRFQPDADAARFLRGALIAGGVVIAFAVHQSVRPSAVAVYATGEDMDSAIRFIQANDEHASSLSVACGDKAIWRHGDEGLAVYQRQGDKMIVLGQPTCVTGRESAVLDALVSHAANADLALVFYQVGPPWTDHLHDHGFEFFKLGEEAIVDITGYNLAGGKRSGLRRTVRKTEEAGVRYVVYEPPIDASVIDEAGRVSDAWLTEKEARELQFSVGYFSPAYLRRFAVGAALDPEGRIVAFVNLMGARPGTEMTADFIRHRADAIESVMEYVLVKSFLWASERGYSTFSLGMAPLFDVGGYEDSPLTEKLARQLFLHGERFYNYQGLHSYKEKFHPEWHPRYLAYQNPWDWAGATAAVMGLVQARSRADRRRIAAARFLET